MQNGHLTSILHNVFVRQVTNGTEMELVIKLLCLLNRSLMEIKIHNLTALRLITPMAQTVLMPANAKMNIFGFLIMRPARKIILFQLP